MMSNDNNHPSPFRFPESEEKLFLEKLEKLETRLDDLEQKVLQTLSEVEIPDSWLEEWEKFTESDMEPDEKKIREWMETHLKQLKGFESLNELEQKEIASLYQDVLMFTKDVLEKKSDLSGSLDQDEQEVMNYINNAAL